MQSPLTDIISPFPASALSINSADFSRCVELARLHGVEMLFYSRLKKNHAGSAPFIDEYLKKTENAYLMAVARSMRQEAVEKGIVAKLGKEGIPVCIIKGNEIARTIYEDPNCRSSADIDILVRKIDFFKADSILTNAGYIPDAKLLFADVMYHTQHKVYSDSLNKFPIEMHWSFGVPYLFRFTSEEIWESIRVDDEYRTALSLELNIIILLIHHHAHSFRELRVLVDLLWAFNKYDRMINWHEFAAMLKRIGLVKTALISLSQFESLWPENINHMQSVTTLKKSFADIGCSVSRFLIAYFRMSLGRSSEKNFYRDKIVARFALDDLDTTILSYVRTLFPPPDVIRELYPDNGTLMLPVNYLRLICTRAKNWMWKR